MPVEKINIESFLNLSADLPILDVRSPGEFNHAHIPGAYSVPIFNDEQRAIIGTAYLKENRQTAVNYGLNYFSERMKIIPGEIENIITNRKPNNASSSGDRGLLIHCWRGGMRSEAVAWLMNLYGYKILLLRGGYKAFRRWTLSQFDKKYSLKIIGGYTGSGKTGVLKELQKRGKSVINLEGLANHKGSAFGALGEKPQPTHEMFENILSIELWKIKKNNFNGKDGIENNNTEIWLEDESVHIGKVGIPKIFWGLMRESPLFFLDIPFEERLNHIADTYGVFDKKELIECILKIQKRLGGLDTKNAIQYISQNNLKEGFAILLKYYDKQYAQSLHDRKNFPLLLNKVNCKTVYIGNADKLVIQ